ncbi:MAG: hypothetical protein KGQ28_05965, partial [Hyphomicrobiales bacterium]|nr:hypothetical protein [Hyphomicrobiales bacterium]
MRKLLDVFSKKESPEEKRLEEEIALLRASPLLDPVWYRETYADLRDTPIDVARHYLLHGAKEGRNPGPEFDTNQYLRINPDIARKGLNPLVYFIGTSGDTNNAPSARDYQSAAEDSNATIAHPLYTTTRTMAEPPEMHIISAHFNHDFYLKANPDVAAAATDPAYHYLVQGWKEGRDPCPWFSTNEYLEQNA